MNPYNLYAAFASTDIVKVNKREMTVTVNGVSATVDEIIQLVWWLIELASDTSAIDELVSSIKSVHPEANKYGDSWEDVVSYLIEKSETF